MGWKDFFKVNKKSFTLFVIFAALANFGISGLFGIFSFFSQFACSNAANNLISIWCSFWDLALELSVFLLNIFWQLFLANLVIILYYKFKK